jgi:hypothetical protein
LSAALTYHEVLARMREKKNPQTIISGCQENLFVFQLGMESS